MSSRPQRRDAQENRERVLDAALDVFSEQGATASTETIATRAGVGVGTVFRHFPTKEQLLEAVFDHMITQLADLVNERGDARRGDAGAAFFGALDVVLERAAAKKAIAEGLGGGFADRGRLYKARLREALGPLLADAQDAGAVRKDIGVDEVNVVLFAAMKAAEHVTDPALRKNTVRVIFDGFRPQAPARRRKP